MTKIELVVIESQDLSSALKFRDDQSARGGIECYGFGQNLLFSNTKESDFAKIKDIWREIIQNLQECSEDQNPYDFAIFSECPIL